ncbi:hypothetical protein LshimejAT787_0702730 [Lyophyllum shimeji]|uniref:Uncharacterized protein n=1 Tax=Lyophyllum shimeji TaxID=47721 RepID=A0A9P3PPN3_LYOSH|nr:hypothetical protein LshimejAT787_0702730 [Lyophyllum shimeji]
MVLLLLPLSALAAPVDDLYFLESRGRAKCDERKVRDCVRSNCAIASCCGLEAGANGRACRMSCADQFNCATR